MENPRYAVIERSIPPSSRFQIHRQEAGIPDELEFEEDSEVVRMIELNGMIALDADLYLADAG